MRHDELLLAGDVPDETAAALRALIAWLKTIGYVFVTPTPATHARVLARGGGRGDVRDAFGWNRPFDGAVLDAALLQRLIACWLVFRQGGACRSRIRVSSLAGQMFVHSAYPTTDRDAVFLGPDSYRFADLVLRELARCPPPPGARLVDIGTGAGVAAVTAGCRRPDLAITMTDINRRALAYARINVAAAGLAAAAVLAGTLAPIEGLFDLVLANPPYLIDDGARDYRDGGGMHGAAVALAMAADATARLAPAGRLILYTGSAIIAGSDPLHARLRTLADTRGCRLDYREIDPDVFGEELATPAYAEVERIALVAAVMTSRLPPPCVDETNRRRPA